MKRKDILVMGNGYLAGRFVDYFGAEQTPVNYRVRSFHDVESLLVTQKPRIVINCIGKTGNKSNVDACETNKDEVVFSNIIVPAYISKVCLEEGIRMVHLSSGCIFEGDNNGKGFSEEDKPNFAGSFYSRTKSMAEEVLSEHDPLQIRLRMPMDNIPGQRNLITKLVKYAKGGSPILDEPNSVTCVPDMLGAVKFLLDRRATGIYNVINKGTLRHPEILDEYQKLSGERFDYERINPSGLDKITIAKRSNCVLSGKKLKDEGFDMPDIHEALRKCMENYVRK